MDSNNKNKINDRSNESKQCTHKIMNIIFDIKIY